MLRSLLVRRVGACAMVLAAALSMASCGGNANAKVERSITDLMTSVLPSGTKFSVACPSNLDLSLAALKRHEEDPQNCHVVVAPAEKDRVDVRVAVTYPKTERPKDGEYYISADARFEQAIRQNLKEILKRQAGATLMSLACPEKDVRHGIFLVQEGSAAVCDTTFKKDGQTFAQKVKIKATADNGVHYRMR